MFHQLSRIINFTSELQDLPNSFCFNPSIAHWKNNLYFVCYRSFIRDPRITYISKAKYNRDKYNHPWHGWDLKEFDYGYDKTGFCIMEILDNKIKLIKSLHDGNSIKYFDKDNNKFILSEDTHIIGQDTRVIKISGDTFMLSYNNNFYDKRINIKNGNNCQGGCTLIATRIVKLSDDGKLYMYDENVLCPEISEQTEKNWSFFKYKDKILFSYGLTSKHLIYSVFKMNEEIKCGSLDLQDKNEYYGNYEKHINSQFKGLLRVSVSTPAIKSFEYPDRFIGVGHMKFKFANLEKTDCEELKDFYINVKRMIKKLHSTYVYLMVIYEFNAINGEITRISNMFIPESTEYLLVFPSGLIQIADELWIFYGDHDSSCNIMTIKNKYVSKLLKEVPENKDALNCEQVKYFVFPQKCYRKSDICLLLQDL